MYFFDINDAYQDRVLFFDEQQQVVTYGDWYRQAALLKLLLRPRALAVILCRNTIGSALSYLCCLQDRIVPILIDNQMDAGLQQKLIDLYQLEYIFQPNNAPSPGHPIYSFYGYTVYKCEVPQHQLHPDLALLVSTSSSTGSPKLVRQSYANIQANAATIVQYLHLDADQRAVSTLPMHYTFGLSVINSHVLCGASEGLTERKIFEPSLWDFCKNEKITSIAGVPFMYERLQHIGFMDMELPHLKLLIQAGGKLPEALQKAFAEWAAKSGKTFVIMYGQTEATARMAYLPAADSLRKLGSIGIAIPGGAFHIMDDDGQEITTPGQIGELCYEGPNVALGYAQVPEDLALGDEWHGHLHTGDMAYVDAEGFYYITGRKNRFIKIMSRRVSLDEIEQLCRDADRKHDFACVGNDDDLWGFTTAPQADFKELAYYLFDKTHLHPACVSLHHIDALPLSSSGKIQYAVLQEMMPKECPV